MIGGSVTLRSLAYENASRLPRGLAALGPSIFGHDTRLLWQVARGNAFGVSFHSRRELVLLKEVGRGSYFFTVLIIGSFA